MRFPQKQGVKAFTRADLLVISVVVAILVAMLLPALAQSKQKNLSMVCVNNLKTIGLAYRVWGDDHFGRFPAEVRTVLGGWQDLSHAGLSGPGAANFIGTATFTNYEILQNQLGQSPKLVVCPADDRVPNTNFFDTGWIPSRGTFNNTNCSYWVGVGADGTHPRSLLGGDRNIGGGALKEDVGVTATAPQMNYGFSPAVNSTIGGDVVLNTNSAILMTANGQTGFVQWTAKMHSVTDLNGAGNLLLGDGSVAQHVIAPAFRSNFLVYATDNGNYGPAGAPSGAVRLVFP